MAQHDYNISNQSGAAFRADLNNALSAIVSNNSGAVEPSNTYAYQFWADTTAGVLKQRNAANSAWVTLFQLDGEWSTIALENGTGAAPSLYFKDSGTDTGLYSPGVDQLGVATAGVQRVNFNGATEVVFNDTGADVDFRIEGDTEPNLFVIDAGTDQVRVKNLNGGPLAGTRNRIINGDMRIDQRNAGASVTASTTTARTYTLDRWHYYVTQASKFTVQRNAGSVTPPSGFDYYLGVTSSSAYSITASDQFAIAHLVEGFNSSDFDFGKASAKSITLSFWVRSSLTGTFGGALNNSSFNRSYAFSYSISSANTWEQKTITVPGDTSGTWLADNGVGFAITFGLGCGTSVSTTAGSWGTSGAVSATGATSVVGTNGATFYITGVQLEPGTVATPFERRSYGQELALCQRYYESATFNWQGAVSASSGYIWDVNYKVSKRTTPTLAYSGGSTSNFGASSAANITTEKFSISTNSSGALANSFNILTWAAAAEL
jgi:hypothetical protein